MVNNAGYTGRSYPHFNNGTSVQALRNYADKSSTQGAALTNSGDGNPHRFWRTRALSALRLAGQYGETLGAEASARRVRGREGVRQHLKKGSPRWGQRDDPVNVACGGHATTIIYPLTRVIAISQSCDERRASLLPEAALDQTVSDDRERWLSLLEVSPPLEQSATLSMCVPPLIRFIFRYSADGRPRNCAWRR
jgi:hypothetical protein